jgi:broad specificity phosphatase PhoE
MSPPIRLYLVRHGQSEANLDQTVNARLPDHRVELSPEGHRQAAAAGEYLAGALPRDARIRILCSPYVRTRQTSAAIEQALTAAGLPYDRREAVELREIAFGLFDGIADEDLPKSFPREYEHYEKHKRFEGEFFAPMPLGESRVHVADRVKVRHDPARRRPRAQQSGRQLRHREPRRDDPLLPDAMDALPLGVVRAREEPAQLLDSTHRGARRIGI